MPPSPRKRSRGTAEPAPSSAAAFPIHPVPPLPAQQGGPIVFYDGSCGLCARLVTLLLEHDRGAAYRFAPLQGETARRVLGPQAAAFSTVVLQRDGRCFTRSGAALRILAGLGGGWRLAGLLLAVPRPLRDAAYGWVARRRRRWFGSVQICPPGGGVAGARFLP